MYYAQSMLLISWKLCKTQKFEEAIEIANLTPVHGGYKARSLVKITEYLCKSGLLTKALSVATSI